MKNILALCFIALVISACSTKDTNVQPDATPDLAVVADMAADSPVDQPSDQSTTSDQSVADLGQPDLSK